MSLDERVKEAANKRGAKIKKILLWRVTPVIIAAALACVIYASSHSDDTSKKIVTPRKTIEWQKPEKEQPVYGDYVKVFTSGKNLNVRYGPSTNTGIMTSIDNNVSLSRIYRGSNNIGEKCDINNPDDWDVVLIPDGRIGYVFRGYLVGENENYVNSYSLSKDDRYIENTASSPVYIRLKPSSENELREKPPTVPVGGRFHVIASSISSDWVLGEYNGTIGFVDSYYFSKVNNSFDVNNIKKVVFTNKDIVGLRNGPSVNYDIVSEVKFGTQLNVIGLANGYYVIAYNNNYYYVPSTAVSSTPGLKFRDDFEYVGSAVEKENIYNANGQVIYTMEPGETCEVLGQSGSKLCVRISNITGFMRLNKLKKNTGTFIVFDIGDQTFTMYKDEKILMEEKINLDMGANKGRYKVANVSFERTFDGKVEIRCSLKAVNSGKRRTVSVTTSDLVRQVVEDFKGDSIISR